MNKVSKLLLTTIYLLLISTFSFAQIVTLEQDRLEVLREDIVFPELSPTEKRTMVTQAQIFLRDLYVHRFEKLAFYPGLEDPVPAVEEVVNNIDDLSAAEMEEALYRIFVSQRDLHLNYIFPAPYANYRSFLPLTFTRTASGGNFFEVRVSSVNQELFEEFAPGQRVPEIGDRVIAYNNLHIKKAVRKQIETAQGANKFGGFSRAIGQMTFVNHLLHLVPEENEINIAFMSSNKNSDLYGSRYSITLPWITQLLGPAPASAAASAFRAAPAIVTPRKINPEDFNQGVDLWQEQFNKHLVENKLTPRSDYPSNPSNDPALTWGIIENKGGRFGYLSLTTFSPATGTDSIIEEIRRIIFEEFADTTGLIFDVRNNGGGSIILADKLSQLFMRDEAQVIEARLLNSDLNRQLFNETLFGIFSPQWVGPINDVAGTDRIYSDTAAFTTDAEANELGQSYYKPIAVLANARSYSATDLFTCAMQDNFAALVYGEDPKTGAGGANVITHALFRQLLPSVFEQLPGNHRMRVSWRQSVRFGPNQGNIIEDFGCSANIDASQTKKDILTGGDIQIKSITKSLAKRAKSSRYRASVRASQNNSQVFLSGDQASYPMYVTNTKYINVRINGEVVDQVPVYVHGEEELVEIQLPSDLAVGSTTSVIFEGVDSYDRRLWNLKRQFIILNDTVSVGSDGFEIDYATAQAVAPVTVVNRNPPEDGWNLVSPNLQIGYNPNYNDNVDTDAILSLDLSERTAAQLSLDLEYDTEANFDFVEVFFTDSEGNNRVSLLRVSGSQPLQTYDFDLAEFVGQDNILLHVRFTSDTNTVAPGVRLQRISIR